MQTNKHIYSFTYYDTESELCKLESRNIFNKEEKNRLLLSNICVEPSISAFIKNRIDLISFSEDYSTLINQIKKERISIDGFKVEYLVFDGDTTEYPTRLQKLRDIGCNIEGRSDYYSPTTTYALCHIDGVWYFGKLNRDDFEWQDHNKKPCSYSNSISINIAKSLVNIAGKADKLNILLDACCGVGTIMLEACFAGIEIEGCEINWRICKNAIENISHFNYNAKVYLSDIKDIDKRYDAAIIDLPYNLVSVATESDTLHIIESTGKISDRLVIVSTSDITNLITKIGFRITDHCSVSKRGKRKFTRRIWVCEKNIK